MFIVVFRVDASIQIGIGHIMRCMTLAEAIRKRRGQVWFVCRELAGNMISLVESKGFSVLRLPCPVTNSLDHKSFIAYEDWLGVGWETDAHDTIASLKAKKIQPDWLIVDHYSLDKKWEEHLGCEGGKIMIVDDLANRPHQCDLLLDQNFYTDAEKRYKDLVPLTCTTILGPKYALLRPEFREARENLLKKRKGAPSKILVFFGGSDLSNVTATALKGISGIKKRKLYVDVIIGSNNPHRKSIVLLSQAMSGVKCLFQVSNMAELMSEANLYIGAAGSTTWERCCLGLPSLVITVAENQERATQDLAEAGYLYYLGKWEDVTAQDVTSVLNDFLTSPTQLDDFTEKSLDLVDGLGTEKVIDKMIMISSR